MADTPPVASTPSTAPVAAPAVTDRRPSPRGVLPRGVQTWLMAGLAVGHAADHVRGRAGRRRPPDPRPRRHPAVAPSADRVRDYQDRLRALEAQSLAPWPISRPRRWSTRRAYREPSSPPPVGPDCRRSGAAASTRASSPATSCSAGDRRRSDPTRVGPRRRCRAECPPRGGTPSVDEIADAAVRATTRAAGLNRVDAQPSAAAGRSAAARVSGDGQRLRGISDARAHGSHQRRRAAASAPRGHADRRRPDESPRREHRGAGELPGDQPVYSHSGQHVLIPAGARVLGETKPVQTFGETRLAVAFHRLLMPDGRTYRLDQFLGLNQIGDAGLRDRVNQHYSPRSARPPPSGSSAACRSSSGAPAWGGRRRRRTVIIAGGVGDATSQATLQVMNRFLNRLPTITIREGHRVKVYLTSDLELPAYVTPIGSF